MIAKPNSSFLAFHWTFAVFIHWQYLPLHHADTVDYFVSLWSTCILYIGTHPLAMCVKPSHIPPLPFQTLMHFAVEGAQRNVIISDPAQTVRSNMEWECECECQWTNVTCLVEFWLAFVCYFFQFHLPLAHENIGIDSFIPRLLSVAWEWD